VLAAPVQIACRDSRRLCDAAPQRRQAGSGNAVAIPKEVALSSQLSVAQVLANLEKQMAFHKDQEAHHAEQETFHREQRAVHAAEYETVAKHYEAFKATSGMAAEIAARTAAVVPAPEPLRQEPPAPVKVKLPSRLVARLVAELPAGEVFEPSRVAAEVNHRYPQELRKPMGSRLASTVLRRLLAEGTVKLVEKGTPHHQAVYTKR
jgi:hypothetical protein